MMTESQRNSPTEPTLLLGGQAVLEGVMMRGPARIATAVRKPDGTIVVKTEAFAPMGVRVKALAVPLLRGAVGMIEMLVVGLRALNFSADVAMESMPGNGKPERKTSTSLALAGTVIISLLIGLALFFVTPLVLATLLLNVESDPLLFNLAAGIIRMLMFLVYLVVIAQLQDIKRLFAYHGAEHKTVFAYERGCKLVPAEAGAQSRFHPRCGTSFLLIVMLSAIVLFALADAVIIAVHGSISVLLRLAVHLPLVPVVAGLSYEVIRVSARYANHWWARGLAAPGLWLQRITTREPDEQQLEVAITALKASLSADWDAEPAPSSVEVAEA
jgi:uncharacterized protein YqhQ